MKVRTEQVISSAHSLPGYQGLCAKLHGHNWRIEVEIEGERVGGMVADFLLIKGIIKELDHQNLNDLIMNPTAENIVDYLLMRFSEALNYPNIEKIWVRVWESDKSYAEDYYVNK